MEQWLNSRAALITAWSIVGALVTGVAGLALYLIIPSLLNASDDSSTDRAALPTGTVVPVTSGTPAGGQTTLTGTIERLEGEALVIRAEGRDRTRVIVRRSIPVGKVEGTSVSTIREGEPVVVGYTISNGRFSARVIRVQPAEVPPGFRATPTADFKYATGTVASLDGTVLRLRTETEELTIEAVGATVSRFNHLALAQLREGQRIRVNGQIIVDGSLIARAVVVLD
ncbi:MAG: hypothetical protein HYX51_07330 [Chloroflexi bacterium]|nr:hypothetical protein [Chloroflexota bacterium]